MNNPVKVTLAAALLGVSLAGLAHAQTSAYSQFGSPVAAGSVSPHGSLSGAAQPPRQEGRSAAAGGHVKPLAGHASETSR